MFCQKVIILMDVYVIEIPMPSSPPKATEVRSGVGKEGESHLHK